MRKYETKDYKINYPDSLQKLVEGTVDVLNYKIPQYLELFDLKEIEQIQINFFDDLEEFREFIYNIRGERDSLPEYAAGTYDLGMVNVYIDPQIQMSKIYNASHEIFHIIYMKYILNNDYSKRIVWYDEGMAEYLSGEKSELKDKNKFKEFYLKVKRETTKIPNMNELEHGSDFCNEYYDGYDLSYLAVKYIAEHLKFKEFKELLSDFAKIKAIGENVLTEMFAYYDGLINSLKPKRQ